MPLADLVDEPVDPKAIEQPGEVGPRAVHEVGPKLVRLEAADGELSAGDGFKKHVVFVIEEVEPLVGAGWVKNGFRDFVQFVDPGRRIIDGGNELKVPAVGCKQELLKGCK